MSEAYKQPTATVPIPVHEVLPPAPDTATSLARSYRMLQRHVSTLTHDLEVMAAKKEAELTEKRQLAHRLQTLLESLPGGVVVLDSQGRVVQCNPAAQRMLGQPLVGERWRDLIKTCFAPRSDDGLEVSTLSGTRLSLATSSLGDEGQIILLTDQSETRRLQQMVSRSEKLSALGKMVSALAHQIRTPLSAAILYADHLRNAELPERQRGQFSEKLFGRLLHMERQVQDMLLFVRQELPLNDVVDLADLEKGLRAATEVMLTNSRCRCLWINQIPRARIRCQRESLISALVNLVTNALQACPAGGTIRIEMVPSMTGGQAGAALSVTDDGVGMSAEQLQKSQELFFTTKSQGTGLGLAVVRSVARAHGGNFELTSQPEQGTRARLSLPVLNENTGE